MQSARITSEAEIVQVLNNRGYQVTFSVASWYESIAWES
jgi:hypothetical protein